MNRAGAVLTEIGVLVVVPPGTWQQREWAKSVGGGVYEMSFVPPEEGVYYVFFQTPSLGVQLNQIPYVILQATKGDAPPEPEENQP